MKLPRTLKLQKVMEVLFALTVTSVAATIITAIWVIGFRLFWRRGKDLWEP